MAVVFLLRAMVALSPTAYRVVKAEQAASGQPGPQDLGRWAWDRIASDDSDEDVSVALSAGSGTLWAVETIEGTFEGRKMQLRWKRDGGLAGGTDDAVTTHHFVYAPGGTPSDTWASAQFEAVEAALATLWGVLDFAYSNVSGPKQARWYKFGPAIVPPQAPVRILDLTLSGTSAGTTLQMPPQVALSVTEKTTDPKSWGRFYLPAFIQPIGTQYGRLDASNQGAIADAVDAFYEACIAASVFPVVYSSAKPERQTAGGSTLPARGARALPVKQIQIDDVFDVIRSRRWSDPLLRIQRDVAGA